MRVDIRVGAWVAVDDRCPIEFSIDGNGDVELLLGVRQDGFEMVFSPTALERFLVSGAEALVAAKRKDADGGAG